MKCEEANVSKKVAYCFQEYTGGFGKKAYFCDLYKDAHVMTMSNYDNTSLRLINWDKEADDM